MIPDLSDDSKMARLGRLSALYKARREAAQRLRDTLIPLLNSIEMQGKHWDVSGVTKLCDEINTLNRMIEELK